MEMVVMAVRFNRIADFLALAVLHPRGESLGPARANSLHAERGIEALVDLALPVDHELFASDCEVAERDDAVAMIVAVAVGFAVTVGVAVAGAVAVAVAVA